MCLEIYELDPAHFLTGSAWAWQASKKTKVKLDPLTKIDTSLILQKGTKGGIRHSIYRYKNVNNKYI